MTENRHNPSRRSFCTLAGGAAVSLAMSLGCSRRYWAYASTAGRLTARPHASRKSYVSGRITLGLDSARDAISANAQIRTQLKLPAVGLLSWCRHGAGQSADEMFDYLGTAPEGAHMIVESGAWLLIAPHLD